MLEISETNYPVSIQSAARLSGLGEHTLRYYEKIGLLPAITRDASSGHRCYSERDVLLLQSLSYLQKCGFSVADMRRYLSFLDNEDTYAAQAKLLFERHEKDFARRINALRLQHEYIKTKVVYWQSLIDGDEELRERAIRTNRKIAKQLLSENNKGVQR